MKAVVYNKKSPGKLVFTSVEKPVPARKNCRSYALRQPGPCPGEGDYFCWLLDSPPICNPLHFLLFFISHQGESLLMEANVFKKICRLVSFPFLVHQIGKLHLICRV